jgi:hypothetical protein
MRPQHRDCVLLSFTPSWREDPDDIRGPVQHLAQPTDEERAGGGSRASRHA